MKEDKGVKRLEWHATRLDAMHDVSEVIGKHTSTAVPNLRVPTTSMKLLHDNDEEQGAVSYISKLRSVGLQTECTRINLGFLT